MLELKSYHNFPDIEEILLCNKIKATIDSFTVKTDGPEKFSFSGHRKWVWKSILLPG